MDGAPEEKATPQCDPGAVHAVLPGSDHAEALCALCAEVCEACADECNGQDMDHCQACARACKHCAEACYQMAAMA